MRDTALGFIAFSDPFGRPLAQLLLELTVLATTLLVFGHALRAYRAGDRRPMFQWLVLTSYGLQMELIAFNFLHNYEHARFTVQLVDGQLPLYVVGFYGTVMYAGMKVAERLGAHPVLECFVAGFAMCLIDVPFDIAGASLGWWTWLDGDPNTAFRWLGVPVTSYYWYLIFGAVAAGLCRVLWSRLQKRSFAIAALVALPAGLLVIFFGVLGFLPFHAVAALGFTHGTLVMAHLVVVSLALLVMRGARTPIDRWISCTALLLPSVCALMLVEEAVTGRLALPGERLGWAFAALTGLALTALVLPLRRATMAGTTPLASEVLRGQ